MIDRKIFIQGIFLLLFGPVSGFSADATAPQGAIPDAYSSILQRGVFGGDSGPASAQQTSLAPSPYKLIGTLQSSNTSGAVLDDGTGIQTFYRIDQKLPDDSRILKVMNDRILIKRTDGTIGELIVVEDVKAPSLPVAPQAVQPAVSPAADAAVSNSEQRGAPRSHRRRKAASED